MDKPIRNQCVLKLWQSLKFYDDNHANQSSEVSSIRSRLLTLPILKGRNFISESSDLLLNEKLLTEYQQSFKNFHFESEDAQLTEIQSTLKFVNDTPSDYVQNIIAELKNSSLNEKDSNSSTLNYSDIWAPQAKPITTQTRPSSCAYDVYTKGTNRVTNSNGNIYKEKKREVFYGKRDATHQLTNDSMSDSNAHNTAKHQRMDLPPSNGNSQSKTHSNVAPTQKDNDIEFQNHSNPFVTARDQLLIDQTKSGKTNSGDSISASSYGSSKRSIGARRGASDKFTPPVQDQQTTGNLSSKNDDDKIKGIDDKMIELIQNEIMDHGPPVTWNDIAGLEFAKKTIQEIVIWPMLRPDIFKGLRGPPKGLLLFGPPGTGKTLIGKCIASQSNATFFSISASSLTSKWVGEGEKMVRALFAVARSDLPAVIFIDEIDSLLSQRSDGEHESSRRIKTEFLVQLDGATTNSEERLLVVGATNRPHELDEAARRRLVKRLYIPLPDSNARKQIINNLMKEQSATLSENDVDEIVNKSDGYSGSDMTNLCREAALGPIRSISAQDIRLINPSDVREIRLVDFQDALSNVRPSVSNSDLQSYINWNRLYGSGGSLPP